MSTVPCPACNGIGGHPATEVDGSPYLATCRLCQGCREVEAWLQNDYLEWEAS